MFYDFRGLAKTSNHWTFNSIASKVDGSVSIPQSPLPDKVIDRIYISNILTASFFLKGIAPAFYKSASTKSVPKITHVLSLISDKPWHGELVRKEPGSTIVQKKILVPDKRDANLMEWFPEICNFIHTALSTPSSQVLIHCHAGISRSATAIACYLIYAHHMTFRDALNILRAARPGVNPNVGFRSQLYLWRRLECELFDEEDTVKVEYLKELWILKAGKEKPDLRALRELRRPERTSDIGGTKVTDTTRDEVMWRVEDAALSPVMSPRDTQDILQILRLIETGSEH